MVVSVYGKAHIMEPSYSIYSIHVTTWLACQVMCHYEYLMTPGCITSKITTDVIMYKFKESEDPRQVLIRIYVSILRENLLYMTGTSPWNTTVPLTLRTTSSYSLSSPERSSRAARLGYISGSPRCFEKSMKFSMALFRNR